MSKSEISKALKQTETPFWDRKCWSTLLAKKEQYTNSVLSQHQFTPATVHSTGLIWFSLIASSLKGPAALAAGDQPGVKWPWPPFPVLMAGKEGRKLLQQLLEDSWNGAEHQQLPAALVLRSALIQQTDAKLSCFFFPFLVIFEAQSSWLHDKGKKKKAPSIFAYFLKSYKLKFCLFFFIFT